MKEMIKKSMKCALLATMAFTLLSNCSKDKKEKKNTDDRLVLGCKGANLAKCKAFLETYQKVIHQAYDDSLFEAEEFKTIIDDAETGWLDKAKNQWIRMRIPYLQTEVTRFSQGPIDGELPEAKSATKGIEIESKLNAWPMDENTIETFIANADTLDKITYDKIEADHWSEDHSDDYTGDEGDEERDVTVGYHALEYLLWGPDGTGTKDIEEVCKDGKTTTCEANEKTKIFKRKLTSKQDGTQEGTVTEADFTKDETNFSSASDKDKGKIKRYKYLKEISKGLVERLEMLEKDWKAGSKWATAFVKDENVPQNLKNVIDGISTLLVFETGSERLVGFYQLTQEEEHSCFSDTTFQDFYFDMKGLQNLVDGTYEYYRSDDAQSPKKVARSGKGMKSLFKKPEEDGKAFSDAVEKAAEPFMLANMNYKDGVDHSVRDDSKYTGRLVEKDEAKNWEDRTPPSKLFSYEELISPGPGPDNNDNNIRKKAPKSLMNLYRYNLQDKENTKNASDFLIVDLKKNLQKLFQELGYGGTVTVDSDGNPINKPGRAIDE